MVELLSIRESKRIENIGQFLDRIKLSGGDVGIDADCFDAALSR